MRELLIHRKENVIPVLEELYPMDCRNPFLIYFSLEARKNLRNELILENIEEEINAQLNKTLYRGILVDNASNIDIKDLEKVITQYATGSFTEDITIANAYSVSDNDGNLDIISEDYYQVIIKFIDGSFLDMAKLINFDTELQKQYSCYFAREKEFYCFVDEFKIVRVIRHLQGEMLNIINME